MVRCQYCCERKAIKKVNYMNKKEPQYAWMCEECSKSFEEEEKS